MGSLVMADRRRRTRDRERERSKWVPSWKVEGASPFLSCSDQAGDHLIPACPILVACAPALADGCWLVPISQPPNAWCRIRFLESCCGRGHGNDVLVVVLIYTSGRKAASRAGSLYYSPSQTHQNLSIVLVEYQTMVVVARGSLHSCSRLIPTRARTLWQDPSI